jgi:mono/diheme cytochrome c family protein
LVGVVAVVLSVETAAAQQDDARMPQGPNRELVIKTCIGCHALSNLYSTVGRTRDGWTRVLEDMTRYGLKVTPEERGRILDYLTANMGP